MYKKTTRAIIATPQTAATAIPTFAPLESLVVFEALSLFEMVDVFAPFLTNKVGHSSLSRSSGGGLAKLHLEVFIILGPVVGGQISVANILSAIDKSVAPQLDERQQAIFSRYAWVAQAQARSSSHLDPERDKYTQLCCRDCIRPCSNMGFCKCTYAT